MIPTKTVNFTVEWPHIGPVNFIGEALLENSAQDELIIIGWDEQLKRYCALGILEDGPNTDRKYYCYAIKQSDPDDYLEIVSSLIGDHGMFLNSKFGSGWEADSFKRIEFSEGMIYWLQDKAIDLVYKIKQGVYYGEEFWNSYPEPPTELTNLRKPTI